MAKCWGSNVQLTQDLLIFITCVSGLCYYSAHHFSPYFKQFDCGSVERQTGGRTNKTNFYPVTLKVGDKYSSESSCHWLENHGHLLAISSIGLQFNVAYLSGFCFWIKPCLTCPDAKPCWAMRLSIFHLQAPTVKLLWSQRDPATSNVLLALKLGLFGCWFL